jgi:lysophospholipase L1-like esterase
MEQRLLPLKLGPALFLVHCASTTPAPVPADLWRNAPPPGDGGTSKPAGDAPAPLAATTSDSDIRSPLNVDEPTNADSGTTGAPHDAVEPTGSDLPRGSLVLHIGDSFAGALGIPLGERLKARGVRSVVKFQTSSYVPTWASGRELPEYVAHYHPDLVLITLGANEFELTAPDTRASAVRRLVQHLDGRPCVWITPPRWKPDSGILAVIQANSKPCRFLDSDTLVHDLKRKPDKVHPSDAAREVWADAVLAWLARERNARGARPWDLKEP